MEIINSEFKQVCLGINKQNVSDISVFEHSIYANTWLKLLKHNLLEAKLQYVLFYIFLSKLYTQNEAWTYDSEIKCRMFYLPTEPVCS